ncbi:MAG: hypothetical protein G01um101416_96 [Microgenomates group bacterium Gr01-1014_16]|nr:MAG: hypothetical protein G01um101416_96 [Microgenomates group bacterium Gr01-1014_16]
MMNEALAIAASFITIVNPVRISRYNPDPAASLTAQYSVINRYRLPATWLFTFDALSDPKLINVANQMDQRQEKGIFLEVTPGLAQSAGVTYHQSASWHFANSVFLSGYTQEERLKLIDTVFAKFKSRFGYHPISVGSWWTDSFSLEFMQRKYSITANLGVSDQYSTDNYQVWGTYWSTPYYPSLIHAGIPASTPETKLDIVTIQWAPREPRRGYYSSLYSTQDYFTTPKLDINYFTQLIELFSQVTVGLESDFTPDVYGNEFAKQMRVVSQKAASKVTMTEFANWYKQQFPGLSPPHQVESDGMLWYQSPFYRLGIDKTNNKIIDFRVYPSDFREPYFQWPNAEFDLRINIPSLIDAVQDSSEIWNITDTDIKTETEYFESKNKPPERFFRSKLVEVKQVNNNWRVEINTKTEGLKDGRVFSDWSLETKHLFKSPKNLIKTIIKLDWKKFKKENYWVSPEEIIALEKLRLLPFGKVMVVNKECLQCPWFSEFRPAAFANSRKYVSEFSQKPIIYNQSIFTADDRSTAKTQLRKTGAKYVYLTKYDNHRESLPFSPGDLGVEKIYSNANVEIWKVN